MMLNPQAIAQMLVQQNPQLRNNPGIQAILNNDAQAGQQYAQNICSTYRTDPQAAAQQAQQFFSQQMGGGQQPNMPNSPFRR